MAIFATFISDLLDNFAGLFQNLGRIVGCQRLLLVDEVVAERDLSDTRSVVIMTQDEGRFGRISDLLTCWAPKGIRPKIPKQIVRTFVYVYAAVCMALGKMTSPDTSLRKHRNDELIPGRSLEGLQRLFCDHVGIRRRLA